MHLRHSQPEISSKDYQDSYGAYFTNVETNRKHPALHYSTIFLARRLLCACVITLVRNVVLQVGVLIFSSVFVLCYIGDSVPCLSSNLNMLELSNEFLVLFCAYYMMLFTDYVGDPELRYKFGWGYIGMLGFGMLFNLLNLMLTSIRGIKNNIIRCRKWNRSLAAEKQQQELKKQ